jgi:hypothetical protein
MPRDNPAAPRSLEAKVRDALQGMARMTGPSRAKLPGLIEAITPANGEAKVACRVLARITGFSRGFLMTLFGRLDQQRLCTVTNRGVLVRQETVEALQILTRTFAEDVELGKDNGNRKVDIDFRWCRDTRMVGAMTMMAAEVVREFDMPPVMRTHQSLVQNYLISRLMRWLNQRTRTGDDWRRLTEKDREEADVIVMQWMETILGQVNLAEPERRRDALKVILQGAVADDVGEEAEEGDEATERTE